MMLTDDFRKLHLFGDEMNRTWGGDEEKTVIITIFICTPPIDYCPLTRISKVNQALHTHSI